MGQSGLFVAQEATSVCYTTAATNSMTANLYSPVEGNPLYVYGDPAYPLSSITRTFQRELKRPTEKL